MLIGTNIGRRLLSPVRVRLLRNAGATFTNLKTALASMWAGLLSILRIIIGKLSPRRRTVNNGARPVRPCVLPQSGTITGTGPFVGGASPTARPRTVLQKLSTLVLFLFPTCSVTNMLFNLRLGILLPSTRVHRLCVALWLKLCVRPPLCLTLPTTP